MRIQSTGIVAGVTEAPIQPCPTVATVIYGETMRATQSMRVLVVSLTVVSAAAFLAGCGKPAASSGNAQPATASEAAAPEPAALTDAQLTQLRAADNALQLDVLCETHNRAELDRALALGFTLIGVNSRDLRTFTMHPELFPELAAHVAAHAPANVTLVAESGLRTPEDIAHLRASGYTAFLIGESLMRQPSPAEALAQLLVQPQPAAQAR